jgi:asparaginyl-tRNA synthetase
MGDEFESVKKRYLWIRKPRAIAILRVQDVIVSSIRDFLHEKGFIEIQAPIIGPVTDPGIRGAK